MDNNGSAAGYFGFGLNKLLDNKLTVLAVTRIGPESAQNVFPGVNVNNYLRFWNDATVTYKATDKLTFVGGANYYRDELLGSAYGLVGYVSYGVNDELTANFRAELYRGSTGLITTGFLSNTAFTASLYGFQDAYYNPPGGITIGSYTAGLTYKPGWVNSIQNLGKFTIRSEVHYDQALNNTTPFGSPARGLPGTKSGQFLFSTDVILTF